MTFGPFILVVLASAGILFFRKWPVHSALYSTRVASRHAVIRIGAVGRRALEPSLGSQALVSRGSPSMRVASSLLRQTPLVTTPTVYRFAQWALAALGLMLGIRSLFLRRRYSVQPLAPLCLSSSITTYNSVEAPTFPMTGSMCAMAGDNYQADFGTLVKQSSHRMPYQIIGGFEGDDALIARVEQLARNLESEACRAITAAEVVAVLELLPFGGRMELLVKSLMKSPDMDRLATGLFDWCFADDTAAQSSVDEEFVLVGCGATRCLNTLRAYALRVLVLALPQQGQTPINLFHKYQATTSTAFRLPFLSLMVHNRDFADDTLLGVYVDTVEAGRTIILQQSKLAPHRADFIAKLVSKKLIDASNLRWSSGTELARGLRDVLARSSIQTAGYANWKDHGGVYLEYLREKLVSLKADPLAQGVAVRDFEKLIQGNLEKEHVLAFIQLCAELKPMEIKPGVTGSAPRVREYLQELSRKGQLDGEYEDLEIVFPGPKVLQFLRWDPAMLEDYLVETPTGLVFREDFTWLCKFLLKPRKSASRPALTQAAALVQRCFAALSPEEFWQTLLPAREQPSPQGEAYSAFQQFVGDFTMNRQHYAATMVIDAWEKMHLRCTPALAPKEAQRAENLVAAWELWTQSFLLAFPPLLQSLAAATASRLSRDSQTSSRSSITQSCGYFRRLLEGSWAAFAAPGQCCGAGLRLRTFFQALDLVSDSLRLAKDCPAVAALNATLEEILVTDVLPHLDRALVWDVAPPATADPSVLRDLAGNWLRRLAGQWTLLERQPRTRAALLRLVTDVAARFTLEEDVEAWGFRLANTEANGKQRKTFSNVDTEMHAMVLQECQLVAGNLVEAAQKANDAEGNAAAWALFKALAYARPGQALSVIEEVAREGAQQVVPNSMALVLVQGYLRQCGNLLPPVLEPEKPTILAIGRHMLRAQEFQRVADLIRHLGLVAEVVRGTPGVSPAVAEGFLMQGQPVSVPEVRKYLQDQTSNKDMHARMEAHVALLNASVSAGVAELAASVQYVADRIKNEPGLTRPQVYDFLESNISCIVADCLKSPQAIDLSTRFTKALEKMLRDDTSKRDCVAIRHFRLMSQQMMIEALSFDWTQRLLAERQIWVTSAIRLQWVISKVREGEEGWRSYNWTLGGNTMQAVGLVTEEALTRRCQPLLTEQCRPADYTALRVRFYQTGLQRSAAAPLTPAEAVGLLCDGLEAVEKELAEGVGRWVLVPANLHQSGVAVQPLVSRMKTLYAYTGIHWTEVPLLVEFLEGMVKEMRREDAPDPLGRFERCLDVFDTVRGLYPGGALWFEAPGLPECCAALLQEAIQRRYEHAGRLVPLWEEAQRGGGRIDLSALDTPTRQFLIASLPHLKHKDRKSAAYKLEDSHRAAGAVRQLLQWCPSAIYRPALQATLISLRDDLLVRYIGRPTVELKGVFSPADDRKERFNFALTPPQLVLLNGPSARQYSQLSLEEGMSRGRSTGERSIAITNFVTAPSTSHRDIIDLLQTLAERAKAEQDDSLPNLVESIVLSVFQTDAAWHTLAYLLSPEVIASSPQRTTASILSSFLKCVQVDQMVRVLRILLQPQRRAAITLFLHKSIVRILMEAATGEAAALLWEEWARRKTVRMHSDLLGEIVRLAVLALVKASPLTEVAWSIVEEAVDDPLVPDSAVGYVLLPSWNPTVSWSAMPGFFAGVRCSVQPDCEKATDRERAFAKVLQALQADVTPAFQFNDGALCPRFQKVMAALQRGTRPEALKVLAECRAISLSRGMVGEFDEPLLDRLAASLAVPEQPLQAPDRFRRQFAAHMYARFVANVLAVQWAALDARRRAQEATACGELCGSHPAARHLQACLGRLLDALLDEPPRQRGRRTQWAAAVREVVQVISESHIPRLKAKLIQEPLEERLRLVQDDAQDVYSLA